MINRLPNRISQLLAATTSDAAQAAGAIAAILALALFALRRLAWLHAENSAYTGYSADLYGLAFCTTLLLILTLSPCTPRWQTARSAGIGGLLGAIFFIATLGLGLAEPTNIEWLLREDWAQHFIGWQLYRESSWQWPPGAFDTFWHPVGTAIIYTDSLPLMAMPLKLVSAWLPSHFQYIGFWLLLNCILQGVFGALLTRCFFQSLGVEAIGAGFFLLTTVFLARYNHDTLTTQWLLLAGFLLYFRPSTRSLAAWSALAAVAALVHPYLSAMLLALAFAFYLRLAYAQRQMSWSAALGHVACLVGITTMFWWLSGIFTLKPTGGNVTLGVYNANILTWINPQYMSRWLPTFSTSGPGQYEGAGYLGLGVLALLCCALPLAVINRSRPLSAHPLWPLLLVCAVTTLYAWGTRFTIGDLEFLDLTPKHAGMLGAFRGSGRFIWLSVYLITLLTIATVARRSGRWAVVLLGTAVVIQLADLSPLHARTMHLRQGIDAHPVVATLHDPWWKEAAVGKHHITLVPPPACGKEAAPYFPFSLLAADTGLTINSGYLARFDEHQTFAYCDALASLLNKGERDSTSLYVVSDEKLGEFRATSSSPMDCRKIEGYNTCMTIRHRD